MPIQSPCVRLCTLDAERAYCVGCGRTLAEIGNWTRYTDAERTAIMNALPSRLARRFLDPQPTAARA
jgi:predicted Fe-S protein YdhL (DUF1289 family)